MKKRTLVILIIALALVVTATLAPTWAAGMYNDVSESHWANKAISAWSTEESAILLGYGNGNFGPEDSVSEGDLNRILGRLLGYDAEEQESGKALTREEAISTIAKAFMYEPVVSPVTPFADDDAFSTALKPYVYALKDAGYIVGRGENKFAPKASFTRAEAVAVVYAMVSTVVDKNIKDENCKQSIILRKGGITVSQSETDRDFVIGQGATDGEIVLDNVTIKGRLLVLGGSKVVIKNSKITNLEVSKTDGSTTLTSDEKSTIGLVVVDTATTGIVTLDMPKADVDNRSAKSTVYDTKGLALAKPGTKAKISPAPQTIPVVNPGGGNTAVPTSAPGGGNTAVPTSAPGGGNTAVPTIAPGGGNTAVPTIAPEEDSVTEADIVPTVVPTIVPEGKYYLEVSTENGIIATGQSGYYSPGEEIELLAEEMNGEYVFCFWNDASGSVKEYSTDLVFEMPESNAEVTALFGSETADSDSDGILDYLELHMGTDPFNADTDGDGLSDYVELGINLDPLVKDTDNNGIEDGDEDYDGDGLSNLEEVGYGVSPFEPDSDYDELSDGDEVKKYGTDPSNVDTDADGIDDGAEVFLGLDPKIQSSDGIVPDGERTFQQTLSAENYDEGVIEGVLYGPEIRVNAAGRVDEYMYFKYADPSNFDLLEAVVDVGELVTNYKGEIELRYDGTELLKTKYEGYSKDLLICKIDEENGIIAFDTEINGSQISAFVKGSGVYVVLNSNEFIKNLGALFVSDLTVIPELPVPTKPPEGTVPEGPSENGMSPSNKHVIGDEVSSSSALAVVEENTPPGEAPSMFRMNNSEVVDLKTQFEVDSRSDSIIDVVFIIDTKDKTEDKMKRLVTNVNEIFDFFDNSYFESVNFAILTYDFKYKSSEVTSNIIRNNGSDWFHKSDKLSFKTVVNNVIFENGLASNEDPFNVSSKLSYHSNSIKYVIVITDDRYSQEPGPNFHLLYWLWHLGSGSPFITKSYMIDIVAPGGATLPFFGQEGMDEKFKKIDVHLLYNYSKEIYDDIINSLEYNFHIVMDDFQTFSYSLKSDQLASEIDTDGDGIYDYQELSVKKLISLKSVIDRYLKSRGSSPDTYKGRNSIIVYKYISDPRKKDTDYDGMDDNNVLDLNKRDDIPEGIDGNAFTGSIEFDMPNKNKETNLDFVVDYRLFFGDNTKYRTDLSVLGSVYSSLAYNLNMTLKKGSKNSGDIYTIFNHFGLDDIKEISIPNKMTYGDDLSSLNIGHRRVRYANKTKEIIVIAIQGTDGSVEQWSSNFDVGADIDAYPDNINPDWLNKSNHKGFDVTSNRLMELISQYENEYLSDAVDRVYYIIGHSRGGSIANIIGANYEKMGRETFVYTYGAMNTTTDDGKYNTIFNVINKDDYIVEIPFYGFKKYGENKIVSVYEKYKHENSNVEGTYYWLTGDKYSFIQNMVNNALGSLEELAENREGLYAGLDGIGGYEEKYGVKYNDTMALTRLTKFFTSGRKELLYQSPAFILKSLAEAISNMDLDEKGDKTKLILKRANFAPAYQSIVSGFESARDNNSLVDPHLQQTYYLISRNTTDSFHIKFTYTKVVEPKGPYD